MEGDIAHANEAIRRCRELREAGKAEAVLRSEFVSRLRLIFPQTEDESWINHYSAGTEAHTKVGTTGGKTADRFIDNLVGSTTIEYELDLRIQAKRDEGFHQVREHVAGLIRSGIPQSQVRGILSDTVEWYVYDANLAPGVDPKTCTPAEVSLVAVDALILAIDDKNLGERLVAFIRKHLARQQSRPLTAEFLTADLGLDGAPCQRSVQSLAELVLQGRSRDSSILVATDLWSEFVDYLEGVGGSFRVSAYTDEVYLCVLARLLSANVLAGHAISSDDSELKSILDGGYFRAHYQLVNMVERDYFGWLTEPKYIDRLVSVAREIQRDLYAYDFSTRPEEDLFGRLMEQLARRSQRQLLGQEWTPSWLARLLAERCVDNIAVGEPPRIVDMCCGSGSIIAEVLKAVRRRLEPTDLATLHEVITGFDIDPLAVSLSKTTWVVTLAAEIRAATAPITIPVYHADSLFAVTPGLAALPLIGAAEPIPVSLDGTTVLLPHALVQPVYRDLFDRIVDWAYDEALEAQRKGHAASISTEEAEKFVSGAAGALRVCLASDLKGPLVVAVRLLASRMIELALTERNGIWAFILRNTYRPALLSGQFNGLVSNPPWLALSALGDNPYKDALTARAKLYGIRPAGQSFLHLELGTTHLLHAVDRYLQSGASVACLVPGTIFNGHHHEPLRRREFLNSTRGVALEITEAWQVAPGTFKYPGAVIIGIKRGATSGLRDRPILGFLALPTGTEKVDFSLRAIGTERTAWVLEKAGFPVASEGMGEKPQQGADLMPRTALCVDVLSDSGAEYRVDTPHKDSPWAFTVKAAKELRGERFPGHVAPRFIFRMAQSENLLPFVLGTHRAPIALPAERTPSEGWRIYDEAEIRRQGFIETARRFQAINAKLTKIGQGKTIQQRIDERGKLGKQVFGDQGMLIVAGAGGKHICAACLPTSEAQELIVDQTLYWKIIENADEAWFYVGMLNSHALTEAIAPFNPKGAFGERHIHSLPYRIMPRFDAGNQEYARIAILARTIADVARGCIAQDKYLDDPTRALTSRRTKLRASLAHRGELAEMESLCALALATSATDDGLAHSGAVSVKGAARGSHD